MKKGFTLVEMLAVILILGIIFLIGVPIYQGVRKSTNESIYESKISNVKSKAEKYSSETGTFVYDIRYMIKEGLLTPDNESGEYLDPRTGRDMQCDLVRIELVDESFYANVEETTSCYDIEDLQNMSSVVKIVFYKTSDGDEAYPNGWIRANTVYAGYTVPEGVTVTKATWGGGWNEVNGRLEITASEILNVPVNLYTEFTYNDQPYSQNVSRKVMLDIQSPYGKPTTTPRTEPTPNLEYIEWQLSDGDGSGVAGHILLNETQYATKKCSEYTPEEIPGNDKTIVGEYLDNGTYYMCVKDNVGNITNDSDAEANRIQITSVDYDPGIIKMLNIESRTPPYQLMDVKIITELKDTNTTGYEMCISHTGYLENCTWEKYEASKDYTIHGYDYGASVLFYISIKDRAGNISNRQKTYIIDKLQRLDLNGKLNGTNQSNIANLGTCDVYINGKVAKTKVTDYWVEHVPGTKYVIKNCTSNSGYKDKGNKEVSGTIGRSGTSSVYLPYVSLYTIKYNMNGGSGSVGNQTKEHGTAIKLATTTSKKTGYAYGGWNTKADGTGTNYNAGANYTNNSSVTLYAKWNPNTVTVSLDNQSAKTAGTAKVYYKYNINKYYSNSATTQSIQKITKPSKNGFIFDGYYTKTNGQGTKYINSDGSFTSDLYKQVNNQILYANWINECNEVTYKDGTNCTQTCGGGTYNRLAYSAATGARCSAKDKSSGGSACNTQSCYPKTATGAVDVTFYNMCTNNLYYKIAVADTTYNPFKVYKNWNIGTKCYGNDKNRNYSCYGSGTNTVGVIGDWKRPDSPLNSERENTICNSSYKECEAYQERQRSDKYFTFQASVLYASSVTAHYSDYRATKNANGTYNVTIKVHLTFNDYQPQSGWKSGELMYTEEELKAFRPRMIAVLAYDVGEDGDDCDSEGHCSSDSHYSTCNYLATANLPESMF